MDLSDTREVEWAEFFDEEGQVPYYVHIPSNKTQSEIPQELKDWKEECVTDYLSKSNWRKGEHQGKVFYYDKLAKTSVWETPAELVELEASLVEITQQRFQVAAQLRAQKAEDGVEDENNDNDNNWVITASGSENEFDSDRTPDHSLSPQYEENGEDGVEGGYFYDEQQEFGSAGQEVDEGGGIVHGHEHGQEGGKHLELEKEQERRAEVQKLEKKIFAKDAVMEPGLYPLVAQYLQLTGKPPEEVVRGLCRGYVGYAQLTHVVCDWLELAEQQGEGKSEELFA